MLKPLEGKYTITEDMIDSILIHQKDRILSWLSDLESCTQRERFIKLKSQVLGAIMVLADMWSAFGYSYKAEEITKRIVAIRSKHEFKDLW